MWGECVHVSVWWRLAAGLNTAEGRDGRVKPSPTGNTGRPQLIHYNWEPSGCHVSWLLSPYGAVSLSLSLSRTLSFPLFVSPSLSISLFLAVGIAVDYGAVPALLASPLWQGPNTHTNAHKLMHTDTHTQAHKIAETQIHIDRDRNSVVSYLSAAHVPHTCKAFTWARHYSWGFYLWRAKLPFRYNLSFFNLPLTFSSLAFPLYI